MGFRTGAYATVWSVEDTRGNSKRGRISISRKNKNTGEYEQSFSSYVFFSGAAAVNAGSLQSRDRIKIGDCDVMNKYDKEQNKETVTYTIYSFDVVNNNSSNAPSNNNAPVNNYEELDEDDIPF